ncbi:MAG: metal-dependent hydrolase [Bacilli bacterium]|nr:metal-dependent hydrolase [Bacilli bacterium]
MTAKTHIIAGTALTVLMTRPDNIKFLTLSVAGGVIGSIIPDIDSKNSETNQVFDKVTVVTVLTIIICFLIEYFFHIGLYKLLLKKHNIEELLITAILFFIMCIIGGRSSHRSITHSILGLIIFTCIINISLPKVFIDSFVIGYASHIVLDLLNHRGIKLFYPIKKRLCLDLCDSDGLINNIIFYVSSIFLVIISISYYM